MSERDIQHAVASGQLMRIRRGWYVRREDWDGVWPEAQHLLHVIAVHRDARGEGPVVAFESAAVIHDLPLYRFRPGRVHTMLAPPAHARNTPDVHRHEGPLAPGDVVVRHGIRCTSLERTILDVARTLRPEAAVSCADAALRSVAVRGHEHDHELGNDWRTELLDRAGRLHVRGIRQARRVISFADGRAQLPGESVSRLQLRRLGFAPPELQVEVPGPQGKKYYVDFGLNDVGYFGEFDGEGKYRDEALRQRKTIEEIMLEEKQREDWIRGRTQRGFARWGSPHIRTTALLAQRLAAFGVSPP